MIREDIIDNESGMHIVFGYAFAPLLEDVLKKQNIPHIRQVCAFLEKMAASEDVDVCNVCDQSVLEYIGSYFTDEELIPYFGEETLEGLRFIRGYILEPTGADIME